MGQQKAKARTAEQHEAALRAFFAGLAPAITVASEAQRALDRLAATNFSVFRYFKMHENRLSDIFADLLRPDGSHGQGTTFLRLFLEEMDRGREPGSVGNYGALEQCSVYREYRTSKGRRIDIVLKLDDKWIGIENKPRPGEPDDQLHDYLKFLRQKDEQARILYLSGDGEDARTIQEEDMGYYLNVPYGLARNGPSVAHWVAECRRHCNAENVRWFLKDLVMYIARMFYAEDPAPHQGEPMNTNKLTADYIRKDKDEERLRMALHVYDAMMPTVRDYVIKEIFEAAGKRVSKEIGLYMELQEEGVYFWVEETRYWFCAGLGKRDKRSGLWLYAGVYAEPDLRPITPQQQQVLIGANDFFKPWGGGPPRSWVEDGYKASAYAFVDHEQMDDRWDTDDFLRRAIRSREEVVSALEALLLQIYDGVFRDTEQES